MSADSRSLLHRASRSAMYSSLGTASNFLLGFLFAGLSIRFLGESRAGFLMLLAAVLGFNQIMGDWGLGTAAVRRVAELNATGDLATARTVVGTVLSVSVLSAFVIAVPIGCAFPWVYGWAKMPPADYPDAAWATALTLIGFVVTQASTSFRATYSALERYDVISLWNTVFGVLNGLAGIGVLMVWPTMTALATLRLGLAVARLAVDHATNRRLLGGAVWPMIERTEVRGMAKFGGWVMVESLGTFLLARMNSLVLTTFLGSAALPYYELPQRLYSQIHSSIASQSQFLFPLFASYGEGAAARVGQVEDRLRWLVALGSAVAYGGLALFGPDVIGHMAGGDFTEKIRGPILFACVQGFFQAQDIVPYYCSYALGLARPNAIMQLSHGALVAATAALLIPHWGVTGACVAQLWIVLTVVVHSQWIRRTTHPGDRGLGWLTAWLSPLVLLALWTTLGLVIAAEFSLGLPGRIGVAGAAAVVGAGALVALEYFFFGHRCRLDTLRKVWSHFQSKFARFRVRSTPQ